MGGYTTKDWNGQMNGWKDDNNAFVFSLTEKVKCINNNQYSIYCYKYYGPYTDALRFYNKKMDEPYINTSSSNYNEANKLYPGKSDGYYKANEVEIFKIIIN